MPHEANGKEAEEMKKFLTREEALAIYRAGEEAVVAMLLELDLRIGSLDDRVKELADQLAKKSHNSNKPPSSDGFQKPTPKSLREKSGRPSGGQPGHEGQTLREAKNPDHIEIHRIACCERCGCSLASVPCEGIEKRQVYDLPPMGLMVTEHQCERKLCTCGHANKAAFPEGVNAPVQYGPKVKAAAVYLKNYQLLPYERTCQLMGDFFGAAMSEGTLANLIGQCHAQLEAPVQAIKEAIAQAKIAQFDESGSRVEKKLWWLHTASTATATYYDIHPKRGTQAFEAIGILPTFLGRAIHDFWKPYFGYECEHALCNAHHLRELIFVQEQHHQAWAQAMIGTLLDIKTAVAQARSTSGGLSQEQRRSFKARYQSVLDQGYAENPLPAAQARNKRGRQKKTKPRNLLERLDHHRREVLAFMEDFNVPFDNNRAERDIRMMKVQQKISGTFRSEEGAKAFCRIRSYLSTARKNSLGALNALALVFSGTPFVPSVNTL